MEEDPFVRVKRAALPETRAWCLAGLIVHFSIAGIIEWSGLEQCEEGDRGCFARGGEDPFVWPDARVITPEICGKDS